MADLRRNIGLRYALCQHILFMTVCRLLLTWDEMIDDCLMRSMREQSCLLPASLNYQL